MIVIRFYLDPVKSRAGPNRRSGHRVFATDDYLYVVGGFNSVGASVGSSTFKDIWKLNLLTNQWTEVKLVGAFADTMASFSLVFVPELDKFYVYGGTVSLDDLFLKPLCFCFRAIHLPKMFRRICMSVH